MEESLRQVKEIKEKCKENFGKSFTLKKIQLFFL